MTQQNNLFDVVVEVRNFQGNLLFLYYPKAGVIEFKRNQIYAQITLASLLEKGTQAIELQGNADGIRLQLPEAVSKRA